MTGALASFPVSNASPSAEMPAAGPAGPVSQPAKNPFIEKKLADIVRQASAYEARERSRGDRYKAAFCAGEANEDGKEGVAEDKVIANFTYAYITVVLALMYFDDPSIQVEPRKDAGGADKYFAILQQMGAVQDIDSARRAYADAVETVLDYSYRATMGGAHVKMALFEALDNQWGCVKVGWDEALGLPRCDALQRHEVYADPNGRFDFSQCRWICQVVTMPIDEAQFFFAPKQSALLQQLAEMGQLDPNGRPVPGNQFWMAPEFEADRLQPNSRAEHGAGMDAALDGGRDKDEKGDQFRFFEIWKRELNGETWVYYRTEDATKLSFRMRWPYTLPENEFPFVQLAFNRVGRRVDDAFSELRIVEGLKKVYDNLTLYLRKYVSRAIAKILFYDKDLPSETVDDIKAAKDFAMVGVDMARFKASELLNVVNLNQGDPFAVELIEFTKREINEVLGQDEIERNADSAQKITATEAGLRNNNAQTRRQRRAGIFDEFQARIFKLQACIARQRMDPGVAESNGAAGDGGGSMGMGAETQTPLTPEPGTALGPLPGGEGKRGASVYRIAGELAALLWEMHYAPPGEYLEEFEISVLAGSSGVNHRNETIQQLTAVRDMMIQTNQIAQMANAPAPFDIQRVTMDILDVQERNADRYRMKNLGTQSMPVPAPGVPASPPAAGVALAAPAAAGNAIGAAVA